jgi:assimilatory nitrate reductase catalytic subunit
METPRGLSEPPDPHYPFLLLTGRGTASQWHTQTRTAKSAVLKKLYPQDPFIEINPADARELGLRPNQNVVVQSQRGRMTALAVLTHAVQRGQVFIPMHYEETNQLTDAVFDPYSKQPSYKSCAVSIHGPSHAG